MNAVADSQSSMTEPVREGAVPDERRILLLAPTGNDARLTQAFLTEAGVFVEVCRSMGELCGSLRRGCGAVVLAEETLDPQSVEALVETLQEQPSWSDTPIAIITGGGEAVRLRLRRLTASGSVGNVTLLERPFHPETLLSTVEVALRARQRQYQVRDLLRSQRASERRLQNVLETISDAFVTLDKSWRFTYVNRSYLRLVAPLYSSVQELLGQSAWEKFPGLHGSEVALFCERAMAAQTPGSFEFYYAPLKVWLEVHVSPSPEMLSIYLRDVTERKHAEASLRQAKEAAEAANQSKDRFLAVLSHELRTPLTPVLMTVAALEVDPELRPDVREDLTMIRRNVELETKLIDDLLDISRIISGKLRLRLQPLDLNDAVRQVCGICRSQVLEKGIRLHCELKESVGSVNADPARLQQVLWNVFKNAAKFTPEGGSIYVTTSRLESDRLQVQVRDTGIGIERETLPRIFDAFEQGDGGITRQFGGLGLGLAISKALVELHHGNIRAESPGPSGGATFTIELPVAEPTQADASSRRLVDPAGEARPWRLLIVEDHADTARTLGRLLRAAGYMVKIAHDAASALELAATEEFDLVVSDLGLPDATGHELMQRLRERHAIKGIAMSGYGMEEDTRRSQAAGFSEHLVKPVTVPQLREAIRRVIGEE
jgi:PAS domain S-box-containing protein